MLDGAFQGGVQVAITWAIAVVQHVISHAGFHEEDDVERGLLATDTDVHITLPNTNFNPRTGSSAGGAVCANLLGDVLGFLGMEPVQGCAVTGGINLRGEILPVGGLIEKLEAASRVGCRLVLAPTVTVEATKKILTGPLKEYADRVLVPVNTIMDVLRHVATGEEKAFPHLLPFTHSIPPH